MLLSKKDYNRIINNLKYKGEFWVIFFFAQIPIALLFFHMQLKL